MEIHRTSLRTSALSVASYAAVAKVNAVKKDKVVNQNKPQSFSTIESVTSIEKILEAGADFLNQSNLKDVFNRPVPTNIQNALNEYQTQRVQPWVNQRAAMLSSVDFYV